MTIEIDFELLSTLGLHPALATRALQLADTVGTNGALLRVIEVHRDSFVLHDGHAPRRARALPRLTRSLQDELSTLEGRFNFKPIRDDLETILRELKLVGVRPLGGRK